MGEESNDATLVIPAKQGKEDQLAQIMEEYLLSLEQGMPLELGRVAAKHPDLAEEIRSLSASLELLHFATQPMQVAKKQASGAPAAHGSETEETKRLGDFEIGPEIGRGGMGVVYNARQLSLERQVALKVLPFAAMWDQKQIARFRNEALAAAQLHHPNIVPVFAVGQERGVHFYAMQYIDGRSLDLVIQELRREQSSATKTPAKPAAAISTATINSTPTTGRSASDFSAQHSRNRADYCRAVAELGRQAAEALHHAHEYGVVHRDIKPSNLMIDDQAKLWITDFGLARVQNSPGVTMTGDVVGTLRYMSPEQAAGQQGLVDSRTDIYSLGATLYELLTLQPAFPGEDRHQVLRDIGAQEPIPPRVLNSAIPLDLETILMQAMAKSRASRYNTAQAMAADLQRFLDGKPTHARRPTLVDRGAKFLRRHRNMAALAALFLVILTFGSTLAALKLAREQQRTEAALTQAEQNFAQARSVVDRFGIQLADQLQDTPGTERLRQQLLVETLQYYRGFAEQIDGQLDVQDQLAMTHLKAGVVTAKLGAHRKAMAEYQAAQQLLESLIARKQDNAQLKSQLALSRNNMALLFAEAGEIQSARNEYEVAIMAQRQLVDQFPAEWNYTNQLAQSHLNLGTLLGQAGDQVAALAALSTAVDLLQSAVQAEPDNLEVIRNLALTHNNRGYLLRDEDPAAAQQAAQRAVELLESAASNSKLSTTVAVELALCYGNLAAIQASSHRTAEATASFGRAIVLRKSLVRKSPAVVRHRSELAANLNNLALLQIRSGDSAAAGKAFGQANQLFAQLLEDYPDHVAYASGWAALLNNQGLALSQLGKTSEAMEIFERAIAAQQRVIEQIPDAQEARDALSRIRSNYTVARRKAGRHADAARQTRMRNELEFSRKGQAMANFSAQETQP